MTVIVLRLFFMLLSVVSGFYIGSDYTGLVTDRALLGAGIGAGISLLVVFVEVKLKSVSLRNLSAAAFGLVFGFFMAWMMSLIVRLLPVDAELFSVLQISFTIVFCYLGMVISLKGKDEFNVIIPYIRFSRQDQRDQRYILDTSVIIDGRVKAICESGFLEGKLVVPRFVLHELQQVADSSDDEKRNRGRRGLDMLDGLKKTGGIEVVIHEERFSSIKEVDAKLIRLGKLLEAPIITNDFNLNKVARLEGIKILNVNDLASATRPEVFPGEHLNVNIRKEGKEKNQGVAFMDDGTMIVIDNARRFIGRTVGVSVTSVLQTSAGRMIFAALTERQDQRQEKRRPDDGGHREKRSQPNGPRGDNDGRNNVKPDTDNGRPAPDRR